MSWRPAQCLIRLREQVNAIAPSRSKASDGTIGDSAHQSRKSDHNPWVRQGKIGIVTALDITHDPDHGCDVNVVVNKLVESRDSRIKYIIWNRRIVSSVTSPWTWREYAGTNPHTRHFHLSVHPQQSLYDLTSDWLIR